MLCKKVSIIELFKQHMFVDILILSKRSDKRTVSTFVMPNLLNNSSDHWTTCAGPFVTPGHWTLRHFNKNQCKLCFIDNLATIKYKKPNDFFWTSWKITSMRFFLIFSINLSQWPGRPEMSLHAVAGDSQQRLTVCFSPHSAFWCQTFET